MVYAVVLLLLLLAGCSAAASDGRRPPASGGALCSSGIECQLNGICKQERCVCDTAWTGANCSVLHLVSPPDFTPSGFHSLNSSWSAWGGGAVYDPAAKKWQGVFHEISGQCGMLTWGANGQTRMAESERPAGPYRVTQLLLPPTATNPSIGRDPGSGTFLVTHMGIANGTGGTGGKCVACPELDGITHKPSPRGGGTVDCDNNPPGSHQASLYNVAAEGPPVGILTATNFTAGPWTQSPNAGQDSPNGAQFVGRAAVGHPEYEGAVFYNVGSGTAINNSRCHNQNAFVRMQMAANLSAAQAGHWYADSTQRAVTRPSFRRVILATIAIN